MLKMVSIFLFSFSSFSPSHPSFPPIHTDSKLFQLCQSGDLEGVLLLLSQAPESSEPLESSLAGYVPLSHLNIDSKHFYSLRLVGEREGFGKIGTCFFF